MKKILKGDNVVVITGKDKGTHANVMQVLENGKVLVKGVNMVKKHTKPNPNLGVQGGIVEKEMPMDVSNVMVVNSEGKGDRVGFKLLENGDKIRVFKSNGEPVKA
uniref:Large ribosomal subunit protein uL24 n=1 Tax=uncultured Thiotrichaceae bacterium TaxID=298394 RepID=A0A6S6UCJ2_9GAMM|nr:MAG: LSU ribosomal protein L24p (L26e) [uncultured Thiotrichaceae bacterium]